MTPPTLTLSKQAAADFIRLSRSLSATQTGKDLYEFIFDLRNALNQLEKPNSIIQIKVEK